jgi:hypothetical protein
MSISAEGKYLKVWNSKRRRRKTTFFMSARFFHKQQDEKPGDTYELY